MEIDGKYFEAANLVSRIQSGDSAGVVELYSTLSNVAMPKLSRTVDSQLVEDRFHDVVVTVLEAIRNGTLREPSRLLGFAQTVTRHRVAAHIRGKISRRRRLVAMGPVELASTTGETPELTSLEAERVKVLKIAFRRLRPRDREILIRFYLREENPQKICAEMGLTATQFRLNKSRALARCAEYVRGASAREIC